MQLTKKEKECDEFQEKINNFKKNKNKNYINKKIYKQKKLNKINKKWSFAKIVAKVLNRKKCFFMKDFVSEIIFFVIIAKKYF